MQIVNLGEGFTQTGVIDIGCYYFVGDFHNAYVVANLEFWSSMLWNKLAMVKDCNCGNSQLRKGVVVLTNKGRYEKRMVNLQCLCCGEIWIVAKYVFVKVVNGHNLCNCANGQFEGKGEASDHLTVAFVQYQISKQFQLSVYLQCPQL